MQDLDIQLKPSRIYQIFLCVVIFISISIVLLMPFDFRLKLAGFIFLSAYSAHVFWQFGLLRSKNSILGLRHIGDNNWLLHVRKSTLDAQLRDDSTVTGIVSILRFKAANKLWPISCIIFRDSLGVDQYRKLLVVLKN